MKRSQFHGVLGPGRQVEVENKANLRCRRWQGRRPEAKGIPTASSLRPFPVSNEPNFAGLAGGGPKRRAKAFTHNCLGVNWGVLA